MRQHFFDSAALRQILAERDMAATAAAWLREKEHRLALSQQLQLALRGALQAWDDAPIQRLLLQGLQQAFRQMDMRQALAQLLHSMTREGRHQQLLDEVITYLAAYLARPDIHGHFAQTLSDWLQREYPKLQIVLPTDKLGKKGADVLGKLLQDFFSEIQQSPQHFVRQEVHASVTRLQAQIPTDPAWQARLQQFQQDLANHHALPAFVQGMAGDLRAWLLADLQAADSRIAAQIHSASLWLANTLLADATLRRSLNQRLSEAVLSLAPDIGAFLQNHIENTLKQWDSGQMVAQIEAQVGPDLQSIRINGTALGGFIGLLLWLLAQGAHWAQGLH